ncbi:TetR family transcriptional regulator [Nocardioides sp. zg-579]|uniref:TetR family transcriptional regulator n=2 Tax=Nocardioides marmotae TaxID=2663857 RepID=A0A6I3JFT4_9ACTN|nr:TetR family transcriptional regulator [Gordonia jinghuaiqii]MTB97124.1 TetR family transcriptional regulator [Nocardioides marmotae]QKE03397.1 TetR family transcriptional regulator [Nocardioides marmotae]
MSPVETDAAEPAAEPSPQRAAGPSPQRSAEPSPRPRVVGEREREILEATLEVLEDVGYDRLTMDAVAARARASKATLYRRWNGKARLVVEALHATKTPSELPDTGSLRGDLAELFCGFAPGSGLMDRRQVALFASVLTAIARDADFAAAWREHVVPHKRALSREVWDRALERGEIRADADLELFEAALPGIVLHRVFVLGDEPTPELVARVIDQIVLPAASRGPGS